MCYNKHIPHSFVNVWLCGIIVVQATDEELVYSRGLKPTGQGSQWL